MMKRYIANLRTSSDEANFRHEEAKTQHPHADSRILCDIPLTDQIESLMRNLPPVQRDRPWSMDELCLRLKGKFSASPHPMHVGQALRTLGWVQRRDWTRYGGGRRVWLGPKAD
jgi:hypothetical protein